MLRSPAARLHIHSSGARLALMLAIAALLLGLAWRRLLVAGLVPIDGHTITFAYPTWEVLRSCLADGRLPLWNPYRNLGEPLLADPQSLAAYPVFWLLSPLAGYHAFTAAWVVLHSALASGFAAALARRWYGGLAAAAAAAVIVSLNGFFTAKVTFPNHLAAAAWLPAALYFQARRAPLGLGACLGLQWLAGFPPFSILTGVAVLGMAFVEGRRGLRTLASACGWALGLAALQWIPFVELLALSVRPPLLPAGLATELSVPGSQLLRQLLVPQWYGWRTPVVGDPAIVGFYVGATALALAFVAFWRGGQRERGIGLAVAACLILSLGEGLPGYGALVPLHVFRFPANWLLPATAGLALLCAAGIRHLPRGRWLALAAVSLDLAVYAQSTDISWAEASFLTEPPELARRIAGQPGPVRIYHGDALMQLWQRSTLTTEEDHALMIDALAPSYGMAFGLHDARSPQTLLLRATRSFTRRLDGDERLLDLAGVAWIVDAEETAPRVERGHLRVWRNSRAERRLAALEASVGEVELRHYEPGRVEGVTRSERPLHVVLAEVDYPGWKASLDGEPVPHGRAEGLFVQVEVPPGVHRLVLMFRPRSFWIGLGISALTLSAMLIRALVSSRCGAGAGRAQRLPTASSLAPSPYGDSLRRRLRPAGVPARELAPLSPPP